MIPSFQDFLLPLLKFVGDQNEHSMADGEEHLVKYFNVTDQERRQLLPSGNQAIFHNRVGWAKTYLSKAGLINVPKRGYIIITQRGLDVLKENPEKIDIKYLLKFPEFAEFHRGRNVGEKIGRKEPSEGDIPPDEIIVQKAEEINNIIKSELLDRILKSSPEFFEKLVIDLVVKMGYGGSFEEASQLLGASGDQGVDGIIKEDVLGLDNVYLQAKRWESGTVSRPEIQKFVGALHGKGAKKGIFITTSSFTKDAIEYAESLKDLNVVLIDKDKLLDYMLKYNVGVDVKNTIEIKKVDEDYFEELI
jgi:restriction system protein